MTNAPPGDPREPPYTGPPPTGAYPPPPQFPGPPPYFHPGYPGYPYPAGPYGPTYPQADTRPGTAVAAAVLGFVAAGLLVLAGAILFFGASFVTDYENTTGVRSSFVAEFTFDGFANLVSAGLLIAGGVALTGRSSNGRLLLSTGGAIVFGEALYWLTRWSGPTSGAFIVYAVIFGSLVVVAVCLAWTKTVSDWLRPPS